MLTSILRQSHFAETHKNGKVFRLAVAFFQYFKPANDLQADQIVMTHGTEWLKDAPYAAWI